MLRNPGPESTSSASQRRSFGAENSLADSRSLRGAKLRVPAFGGEFAVVAGMPVKDQPAFAKSSSRRDDGGFRRAPAGPC